MLYDLEGGGVNISGELLERPALNRLREDASKGLISQVICYNPDRLSQK